MTEQKRTGALEEWRSPLDHLIAELFLSWSFCYSSIWVHVVFLLFVFFFFFHRCYHLVFRGKTCCCVCSFSVGVCWLQTLSMISILVSNSILNGKDFLTLSADSLWIYALFSNVLTSMSGILSCLSLLSITEQRTFNLTETPREKR